MLSGWGEINVRVTGLFLGKYFFIYLRSIFRRNLSELQEFLILIRIPQSPFLHLLDFKTMHGLSYKFAKVKLLLSSSRYQIFKLAYSRRHSSRIYCFVSIKLECLVVYSSECTYILRISFISKDCQCFFIWYTWRVIPFSPFS